MLSLVSEHVDDGYAYVLPPDVLRTAWQCLCPRAGLPNGRLTVKLFADRSRVADSIGPTLYTCTVSLVPNMHVGDLRCGHIEI